VKGLKEIAKGGTDILSTLSALTEETLDSEAVGNIVEIMKNTVGEIKSADSLKELFKTTQQTADMASEAGVFSDEATKKSNVAEINKQKEEGFKNYMKS